MFTQHPHTLPAHADFVTQEEAQAAAVAQGMNALNAAVGESDGVCFMRPLVPTPTLFRTPPLAHAGEG